MQKNQKKYLLIPYITAGYPSKKLFVPILKTLSESDADYIEIGVPHSDPLADGPLIQYASKVALENGVTLKWIVETLHATSLQGIKPLILFSYFNPILNYGLERLLYNLPRPLFYGLIIPDLPLEEAKKYLPLFAKHKLYFIPLVAPTTKKERLRKIAEACNHISLPGGFIYLVSVTGVTGIRRDISLSIKEKIQKLKSCTKKPIVVGFGISNPEHMNKVISLGGDGIVIGSAIVDRLQNISMSNLSKLKSFIDRFKRSS